jgi:hypothetical protein
MPSNHSDPNPKNSLFSLKSIIEKEKLIGTTFMDWFRNLKIVLKADKKLYVLEGPIPEEHTTHTGTACQTWEKHVDDSLSASCILLATMVPKLQRNLEDLAAYDMSEKLKAGF